MNPLAPSLVFNPLRTSTGLAATITKTLIYGEPGSGKTWQLQNYQKRYGRGLILSLEAGLRTLKAADIDYLRITSWAGGSKPDAGEESYWDWKDTRELISNPAFATFGYTWLGLDSLTELGDLCMNEVHRELTTGPDGKPQAIKNKYDLYTIYNERMVAAVKWFRDQPYHVCLTALVRAKQDDNGADTAGPMIKGSAAAQQIPGIVDNIFFLTRRARAQQPTAPDQPPQEPVIERFFLTDSYKGFFAKSRDPYRSLRTWEKTEDVTELLERVGKPAAPKAPAQMQTTTTP